MKQKYAKWNMCKHMKEVRSLLIVTEDSCPNNIKVAGMCAVTKVVCEQCKNYEADESKVIKR